MTSRFLQLFKRGRYVSVRSLAAAEADKATRKIKHQERERFAVAAVAFCLEHDIAFKRHFLKVIADLSPQDISSVTVEPEHWGDLVLKGKWHILVLEFKLGALLQDHQSPDEARIFETEGYGAKILAHFPTKAAQQLQYIVIGKEFSRCNPGGLQCSSVPWRKLLVRGVRKETAIEKDLYDCLGYLGAPVFLNRNMKNPKLAPDARQAMNVCGALQHILAEVGLTPGRPRIDPEFCGVDIRCTRRQNEETLPSSLMNLVKPAKSTLGWIGYDLVDDKTHLSVWFYSTPESVSDVLLWLNGKGGFGVWEREEEGYAVFLRLPGDESTNDVEWFRKVLRAAGALRKPRTQRIAARP